MVLADTNILSTFAKIDQLNLLIRLFAPERVGLVPAVYTEFQNGVDAGYTILQTVIELVQQGQFELTVPASSEIFQKDNLPRSFDAGERETLCVAQSRSYPILTNETQVKRWCERNGIAYWDLPGILRALWRMNFVSREQVQSLIEQIEAKDRIVFKNKEQIFQE